MFVGLLLGALFVTPIVLTYLLIIRWADRFEPEPWWLIFVAFAWGAVFATTGGGMISSLASTLSGTLGVHPDTVDALGATVFAPVFEEGFKGLGVALIALASALGLRELDGPLDGAIYGGVVGLGFTLTEDILYVGHQFAQDGPAGFAILLFLRTILLGLSHCTFTACTGLGFGIAMETKSIPIKVLAPMVGFGCAMLMHAMHNALPTLGGAEGLVLMIFVSWAIDVLFFVLLAVLVVRDRTIVIRELFGEVGNLLHPKELRLVSSYFRLSFMNLNVLLSGGWQVFRLRRKKQLQLVELAFVKSRRRRGESGIDIDRKEAELRAGIDQANREGVWLGG
jgi:RsiW-degrading membrane proteinase PrsW (M82 family)